MASIDSEIKQKDPNSVDAEQLSAWKREQLAELSLQLQQGSVGLETVQLLLQQQQQLLQELYCRVRSEEDIDYMARSLDSLMLQVFGFLKIRLLLPRSSSKSVAAAAAAAAAPAAAPAAAAAAAAAERSRVNADYSPCADDSPLLSPSTEAAAAAGTAAAATTTATATAAAAAAAADCLAADVFEAFVRVVLPVPSLISLKH
ncbi:hypothetical protein EPH_0000100 [Eimeria praecox]|uniref:Uncharacterized protein n=1 Tax=Eimeria praecox TaxID=51316 RepID=U6H875_9EIME|nr:hypothetical protein EPH_0000100 [Eimeria praecox]